MEFCEQLLRRMDSLVIFRHLLDDPILSALHGLLTSVETGESGDMTRAYAAFVEAIYRQGGCLARAVAELLREDDNLYVRRKATKREIPAYMEDCLAHELAVFADIAALTPRSFRGLFGDSVYLAGWEEAAIDITADYQKRTEQLSRHGYGIYARYTSFILRDGAIVPVKYPDRISLPDIDVDFDDDGRGDVLRWVTEKYGQEKVAHIITYSTMATKMAVPVRLDARPTQIISTPAITRRILMIALASVRTYPTIAMPIAIVPIIAKTEVEIISITVPFIRSASP